MTKALRFADPPDGASGEDMADGNAPPPPRFQFRRDLPSQSNVSAARFLCKVRHLVFAVTFVGCCQR